MMLRYTLITTAATLSLSLVILGWMFWREDTKSEKQNKSGNLSNHENYAGVFGMARSPISPRSRAIQKRQPCRCHKIAALDECLPFLRTDSISESDAVEQNIILKSQYVLTGFSSAVHFSKFDIKPFSDLVNQHLLNKQSCEMSAAALTLSRVREQVNLQTSKSSEDELKRCEELILAYAKKLAEEKDCRSLQALMVETRPFYIAVGKAKASKLVRNLVDISLTIDQGKDEKIVLVQDCVEWAASNHSEFLRRSLQARLVRLYNDVREYTEAQKLAHPLGNELKKLEDRELLIEVSLEESKSAFYLNNFAKAKCALVLAKTNSNGAYISPQMQAAIDLQSGILYSADERDFKTSFSYFYEAFEGFIVTGDKAKAATTLKYMLLCKIMTNEASQIAALLASKEFATVKGKPIDALKALAEAFTTRSLKLFQKAFDDYKEELVEDKVVATHTYNLQKDMLEKEISRVIEPYSEVELSYIARLIGMTIPPVERALATMILDKKLHGCIDQHAGVVIIYPSRSSDKLFKHCLTIIKSVAKTVDASYHRAQLHIK
ncbi:unnamed protein product [Caenorhabditis auriculariae]|uniref:PCI domain-containing protein n=1 Tax=Caenorhabditis auriculariae TaxID=2777116 RepID=A0A8S1GYR7_9PELO|nr:unnamed protein product [Caenorhabditis auriculariae]